MTDLTKSAEQWPRRFIMWYAGYGTWLGRSHSDERPLRADEIAALIFPADQAPGPNWAAIDRIVGEHVVAYVMEGDEGCHTPTEGERLLIEDAIRGLLEDGEFVAAMSRAPNHAAELAEVKKENIELRALLMNAEWKASAYIFLRDSDDAAWRPLALNQGIPASDADRLVAIAMARGAKE
jgi:hypothetical protein